MQEEQAKRLVNAVEVVEGSVDDQEEEESEVEPAEATVFTSEDLANVLWYLKLCFKDLWVVTDLLRF